MLRKRAQAAAARRQHHGTQLGPTKQAANKRRRLNAKQLPHGEPIPRLFEGERAFIYATGPSLTPDILERAHAEPGWRHIAISDYYRTGYPCDFYYACDDKWWRIHYNKVKEWNGCTNGLWCTEARTAKDYHDLHLINGRGGNGWSTDQNFIHYGGNSGFQITNIAFLLGIKYMVLLGFNMMKIKGDANSAHFFGSHPKGLSQSTSYQSMAGPMQHIKPEKHGVTIINATQPTGLTYFPQMELADAIADISARESNHPRHRTQP